MKFLDQPLPPKRLLSYGFAVGFLSLNLVTGCTPIPTANIPDPSLKTGLKLGSILPLTGELSDTGQDMPKAVELAVEEINACGGVNGKPVTLISKNSNSDLAVGATVMTELAEDDQVAGVIGARASSVSNAIVDIAVRNKIMLISPSSTSPNFTARARQGNFNGYWARTVTSDAYQAKALAKLAHQQGLKTISTLAVQNDYGLGFERQFVNAFTQLGGQVLGDAQPVRYDSQKDDFEAETKTVLANKAEGVAAILYAKKGSLVLQSAYKQGLNQEVKLLLTDGVYSENFVKQVGKTEQGKWLLEGAIGTVVGVNSDRFQKFSQKWQETTGSPVSTYFPHTWDATVLMMLSAEAAKSNTGRGIVSNLREVANAPGVEVTDPCEAMNLIRQGKEINYQGVSGDVDIDQNGDVIGNYNVWQVQKDGKLAIIGNVNPLAE